MRIRLGSKQQVVRADGIKVDYYVGVQEVGEDLARQWIAKGLASATPTPPSETPSNTKTDTETDTETKPKSKPKPKDRKRSRSAGEK